ncbi:SAM-dependent methyltransferase [Vibrio navarrensis]|uniref:methyltransferase n=1 Tax=Vibrio navarrensis TaxID=29495 RepID=UPI00186A80C9|nr:methyltransferase [Vibrio navarrensis]MBE4572870.1 SAM-dependent methyltransferase [Vibrio navarrensis]
MQAQFHFINDWLLENEDFWRFEPFHRSLANTLPWQASHPELCNWLSLLSHQQIAQLKTQPEILEEQLKSFFPSLSIVKDMADVASLNKRQISLSSMISNGIPGRKLQQITAMGAVCLDHHAGDSWLEWCAGKGYLGRVLAGESQQPVTSFEYQHALCEEGQKAADELNLAMSFVQGDAFDERSKRFFHPNQHAVALHACGDLHVRLIQNGTSANVAAMSIAPCCYHLIQDEAYQALSIPAQQSKLKLSKKELRIPLQQTVTGGERVKRQREQEMIYRLAFDLICREQLQLQEYVPVPSIKKSQLNAGFAAFCRWAATQKSLCWPKVDYDRFETLGEERFWRMERLSLVQQIFQRPLEMWLVYDRVLFLQQHGYHVDLFTFCERRVTPRNLLIQARKMAPTK